MRAPRQNKCSFGADLIWSGVGGGGGERTEDAQRGQVEAKRGDAGRHASLSGVRVSELRRFLARHEEGGERRGEEGALSSALLSRCLVFDLVGE
jgi:hypothetical protein